MQTTRQDAAVCLATEASRHCLSPERENKMLEGGLHWFELVDSITKVIMSIQIMLPRCKSQFCIT